MGILAWVLLGLVAGALAKFIMPGRQGGGIILTTVLGVVGALVGGLLGTYVLGFGDVSGLDLRSIAIAVGGALLVLFVYGLVAAAARSRPPRPARPRQPRLHAGGGGRPASARGAREAPAGEGDFPAGAPGDPAQCRTHRL